MDLVVLSRAMHFSLDALAAEKFDLISDRWRWGLSSH